MKYEFIAVDIQNEFATEGGLHYTPKPSVRFLNENIFPVFESRGIKINNIVSDYRQPRPGDRGKGCVPETWGYETLVPKDLIKFTWIKCMNSPIWVRENIGDPNKEPGLPYQDPKKFQEWLDKNIGKPDEVIPVLMGLTIDCCVLSTLQELNWHGYYPLILKEAVDHATGKIEDRDKVLETPASNWGKVISWEELSKQLNRQ